MESILRAATVYLFLFVLFRASGKRTLAQITTFDFVLLLVVGEATQQGLLGDDFSVTNAFVVVATLIAIDVVLSLIQSRFPWLGRYTEGLPVVVVADGKPIPDRMHRARVDESDVMEHARESQGLERLDQVKYAVVERNGAISIIPK